MKICLARTFVLATLFAAGNCMAQVDVYIEDELPTSHDSNAMIICPLGASKRTAAVRYSDIYSIGDPKPSVSSIEFVPPRLLNPPEVSYPLDLWAHEVEGFVSVAVRVDEKGEVSDPKIICSTDVGFEVAAINAIPSMKYEPATLGGKPVIGLGVQPFRFSLN